MLLGEAIMANLEANHQLKSKKRVTDHGEVFTAQREVNGMLDLVLQETLRIDSRFLEPACGTGNFLVEVFRRKLSIVENKYKTSQLEFERYGVLAASSLYGVDILMDNVEECRSRLFETFKQIYSSVFNDKCKVECLKSVKFILSKNILWGDALTLKRPNSEVPISFSEWSAVNGSMVKRRDFTLSELLANSPIDGPNLFSDIHEEVFIPRPIKEYPLTHFLRLFENE